MQPMVSIMTRKSEHHNIAVACLATVIACLCLYHSCKTAMSRTAPNYNKAAVQAPTAKEERKPERPYEMPRPLNVAPAFDVTPWKYCYNPERMSEEINPTLVFQSLQPQTVNGKSRRFFSAYELGIPVRLSSGKGFDGVPDATTVTKTFNRYAWDIDARTGQVQEIIPEKN